MGRLSTPAAPTWPYYCRQGKTNCCTSLQCLGVHCDGGMYDYLALPADRVFPTDGLPLDQAALVEFLAIGAHAARRAEIKGGERTLIVGAGPIGIATATFAKARGAQVTFLDPRGGPARLLPRRAEAGRRADDRGRGARASTPPGPGSRVAIVAGD